MPAASSPSVIPFESYSQPTIATEKHYNVTEVSKMWGVSGNTVRRIFDGEPGVVKIQGPSIMGRKRQRRIYCTLRIPERVLLRVHARISN